MRTLKMFTITTFALLTFALLASAKPAMAQGPAYLHALSNLRQARGWIQADGRPQFGDLRRHAVHEIDMAINEVKRAAQDDGKDTNFTPPPASGGQNAGAPISSALHLLDDAHNDVAGGQDMPQNVGIQMRALQHIDAARGDLREIRRMVTGQ